MINVPEHVGGCVLGEQVEQEPVADVATAEEIVGEAHVLRGEVTEPKSVISAKSEARARVNKWETIFLPLLLFQSIH